MEQAASLTIEPRTPARIKRAVDDLWSGLVTPQLWLTLARQDIRGRYRGSVLGPFWIAITLAATVFGIGLLFGELFAENAKDFFPYIAVGLSLWMFISASINEGCRTFMDSANFIKQSPIPLSTQVWRVVARNVFVFAHNLVFLVPLLVWSGHAFSGAMHWALIGFALLLFNLMWITLFCATMCARFRDVPQIVSSLLQMAIFISPVFWRTSALSENRYIAEANPLTHMLDAIRTPLLSTDLPTASFLYLAIMAVVGWGLALFAYLTMRHRLVYYV